MKNLCSETFLRVLNIQQVNTAEQDVLDMYKRKLCNEVNAFWHILTMYNVNEDEVKGSELIPMGIL